jgi:hypothetical protein
MKLICHVQRERERAQIDSTNNNENRPTGMKDQGRSYKRRFIQLESGTGEHMVRMITAAMAPETLVKPTSHLNTPPPDI